MSVRDILIEDFDYELPADRIASRPLDRRDACKLLEWRHGVISEHIFSDLPSLLPENSVVVYNNTRVINARLRFVKSTGASIEVFCLEPVSPADYALNFASMHECEWLCFVGNSKRWKNGQLFLEVNVGGKCVTLTAERLCQKSNAWIVRFCWTGDVSFSQVIEAAGEIPVPPYLNRPTQPSDAVDYQTVYSNVEGSVAAPTAGLHFTPEVMDRISERGIKQLEVTLHVGAGTFQPVKSDAIGEHPMHSEFIAVDKETISSLATTLKSPHAAIVAVGTTSVRTLESLYHAGCLISQGLWNGEIPQWYPYEPSHPMLSAAEAIDKIEAYLTENGSETFIGSTRLIIAPGYQYRIVSGMVTNFHQPRSTLLLLVAAFIGEDNWQKLYQYALAGDFRFLSYGDACFLLK